jgi:hypothetical protein
MFHVFVELRTTCCVEKGGRRRHVKRGKALGRTQSSFYMVRDVGMGWSLETGVEKGDGPTFFKGEGGFT